MRKYTHRDAMEGLRQDRRSFEVVNRICSLSPLLFLLSLHFLSSVDIAAIVSTMPLISHPKLLLSELTNPVVPI
jgi:hypothetical protein